MRNNPRMSSKRFRDRRRAPDKSTLHVSEGLPMSERAKLRPANYAALPAQEQWAIDKALGILDWDGKE